MLIEAYLRTDESVEVTMRGANCVGGKIPDLPEY